MRAALYFKLPEEREDFEDAQNGVKYRGLAEEIRNLLRSEIKYGGTKSVDDLYQEICELCVEAGI